MAGGGGTMQAIDGNAAGEGTSLKAALTGQAPAPYGQNVFSDYAPIEVAALQNARPTAQPTQATFSTTSFPSLQAEDSPFRRSSFSQSTPSTPSFFGSASPFYVAQRAPSAQPQANLGAQLAQQYGAYTSGYQSRLAAAEAQRRADAYAAQQAYETARGNKELQAQYQSQIDDLRKQLETAQQNQWVSNDNSNYGWYSGATGGDVGIAGLRRRK